LIEVCNLKKYFPVKQGILNRTKAHIKAIDGITFGIRRGETFSLVGESGSGKSTVGRTLIKLQDPTDGRIRFEGMDITFFSSKKMRPLRKEMQMIFQDPFASLDPRMKIGQIIAEPMLTHHIHENRKETMYEVDRLLERVGLQSGYKEAYPNEFSGGQRQRISIARALALKPKFIIADESTAALDVSIQAQIVNLLKTLQQDFQLTMLFISHDLSVVKHISDTIAVMYLGHILEIAPKRALFAKPLHPYTQSLLSAIPQPDPFAKRARIVLQGDIPSPVQSPTGCPLHPRCPHRLADCDKLEPKLVELEEGHSVACHLHV
jgi:oligopeptide/dipeptide ABC transporter ATP-binding protein